MISIYCVRRVSLLVCDASFHFFFNSIQTGASAVETETEFKGFLNRSFFIEVFIVAFLKRYTEKFLE